MGISGIYYAAKLASCDEKLLTREEFLSKLEAKLVFLLKREPGAEHLGDHLSEEELFAQTKVWRQDVANLVLVCALIRYVCHSNATIVAKRGWKVGGSEFLAGWGLGCFLEQAGVYE